MRRALAIVALVLAMAGCGSTYKGTGTISGRSYDDPDSWITTVFVGKVPVVQTYHDPEHFYLIVTDSEGKTHKVEVSRDAYERCHDGARWSREDCIR